jgi:hypothetical protein
MTLPDGTSVSDPPFRPAPTGSIRVCAGALFAAAALAGVSVFTTGGASAASPLLESVKQNPQLARSICAELRTLNAQGIRSTSPQAIAMVAQRQGLSTTDAEILTTYVVGLHCPDVR